MADGFDECHKNRLVSKRGRVRPTPLLPSLYLRSGRRHVGVQPEYLDPSDPDGNHIDLLTRLLIVCY